MDDMAPIVRKAVFPAAGLGTRFLPATKAQPKEMLPLVDKPLIQYGVEEAIHSGIPNIIIVTGRGKTAIEDHFDVSFELEHLLESRKKHAAGRGAQHLRHDQCRLRPAEGSARAGACRSARAELVGDEPFAVVLSDDVIDAEVPCLRQLLDIYDFYGASVLALMEVPDAEFRPTAWWTPNRCITRAADRLFRIRNLVEKPNAEDAPSNLAIIGRYVLTPEIFDSIEAIEPGRAARSSSPTR